MHIRFRVDLPQGIQNRFFTQKCKRKNTKISRSSQIYDKCWKNCLHLKNRILNSKIRQNRFFLQNPNIEKVNSPKHICLKTTHGLFPDKNGMKLI